jgi:biotin/methionine sulfoxide reductase
VVSVGHFHGARGQLRRLLAASGGFVEQTSNYSFGTALTFLPHILGSAQAVTGPLTSWSSIARHTRLFVMFGGANPKNTQVAKGGCAWHGTSGALAALAQAGVRVVNISPIREDGPEAVRPEWIAIRPNTDTAMMLALAHTLIRPMPSRRGLSRPLLHRVRARPAAPDRRNRRSAKGRGLGGGDHRRAGRDDPRAGAADGGCAHG